jgi:hypothetical protein
VLRNGPHQNEAAAGGGRLLNKVFDALLDQRQAVPRRQLSVLRRDGWQIGPCRGEHHEINRRIIFEKLDHGGASVGAQGSIVWELQNGPVDMPAK